MNYSELIEQLFQINFFNKKKENLENCLLLDKIFDRPHSEFKTIHIAGTNGKGSVAAKMAKTLQLSGYKVGLFTSPHLYCFRERIRINDEKISEKHVQYLLSLLFETIQRQEIPATFFEIVTYLAFLYFKQEGVDYAVIETGLGGRLDATNLINPLLSIITSISLDHTEVLGNTIELIAEEKAGIIKPQVPVIIGNQVPLNIIKKYADRSNSPCTQIQQKGETFQEENSLIALESIKHLSDLANIPRYAIQEGLKALPPCRFELISSRPQILLDVAHNPAGLIELFKAIKVHFPEKKLRILFGLSKSKDIKTCLEILIKQKCFLYPVEASNGRGASVDLLKTYLNELKVDSQLILSYPNLIQSVNHATLLAKTNFDLLVVCGSFYIMNDVKTVIMPVLKSGN